ncbi:hypothetical protein ACFYN9_39750 [Streptomyces collinus]|uniref:hypothetical protein n=1 Tax=Streptomyces collinus TaxID=42684 RepID=UPI0036879B94
MAIHIPWERALVITGVLVNVIGFGSTIAAAVADRPALTPVGIAFMGVGAAWALWKYIPFDRLVVVRSLVVGLVAAITLMLVAVTWPDEGARSNDSPEARQAAWNKTIARLKRDIAPAPHATIGCTATVSGTGYVPKGWEIWAANLNDVNGSPDTSMLFHLSKAPYVSGDDSWETSPFPVGNKVVTSNKFWIFVYLVPQAASSVVENTDLPDGWSVSLHAPISGSIRLAKLPVERAPGTKCE